MNGHKSRTLQFTIAIVAIVANGCQTRAPESTLTGRTMGTTYTVRIGNCPREHCGDQHAKAIEERLRQLEQRFSHYQPNSELSRFNRYPGTDWFPVSAELAAVAAMAAEVSQLSEGAFDITVAPAVNAWGFGPERTSGDEETDLTRVPDRASLQQTVGQIDYRRLTVRSSPPALRKTHSALKLDMSAIAKGYAVDQIAYQLETAGVQNYLVEIGGELRTAGTRPDGKSWRIAIEPPSRQQHLEFIVLPGNSAVATSGDYRNFFEADDIRYSHAIDPATGRPIRHGLTAVSVVAPSAAQADALATALLVLGTDRGMELATRHNFAALFTERVGDGMRTRQTPAMAAYLLNHK